MWYGGSSTDALDEDASDLLAPELLLAPSASTSAQEGVSLSDVSLSDAVSSLASDLDNTSDTPIAELPVVASELFEPDGAGGME